MIAAIYTAAVALAQTQAPGRGDNPSETGGLLIIVGSIVVMILLVGAGAYLVARSTARRRGTEKQGSGHEG